MNPAYLPVVAALAGSIIGGLTSITIAWLTQNHQASTHRLAQEKNKRQKLYMQFIEDASKLYADALVHDESELSTLVRVYSLISRTRVLSSSLIVERAHKIVRMIVDTYFSPNMTFPELRDLINSRAIDPLRQFSEACRRITEVRKS